ncbi:hypothetical protein CBA19CS11_27975 [Caballeronia novacaledonica]|nr:hypothetical protein CBA19CS11_27975 [Caballeronia novacaledonica]
MVLEYAGRHKGIVELGIAASSRGYAAEPVKRFDSSGGIAHILLSHRDDVEYAEKYARQFGARVWIHREENRLAAPCATDIRIDRRKGKGAFTALSFQRLCVLAVRSPRGDR